MEVKEANQGSNHLHLEIHAPVLVGGCVDPHG